MSQTSLDDLKSLNKGLEIIFWPTLLIGFMFMISEMIDGTYIISSFFSGAIVMFSVLLSYLWISSMNKEEVVVLLKLKGDLLSLAKDEDSKRQKVWNFVKTSYRIVSYPTIALLVIQITLYRTINVTYSITEIALSSICLVTLFIFLPLQLRIQKLRRQSHKMIKDANNSNVQSHLLLHETKIFKELQGEEYKLLLRTVAINSEIINSENKFLNNTEADPNITILRYILPVVFSVILSFPIGTMMKLIVKVI
jgi:hypothetical protein